MPEGAKLFSRPLGVIAPLGFCSMLSVAATEETLSRKSYLHKKSPRHGLGFFGILDLA
jgi:hypothetical protein